MTRLDGGFDRALDDLDLRTVTRSPVLDYLHRLLDEYRELDEGQVATYIPELAGPIPNWFGICVVTADGHVYEVGDTDLTSPSSRSPSRSCSAWRSRTRAATRCCERVGRGAVGQPVQLDRGRRPQPPVQPDGERRRHRRHRSHRGAATTRSGWSAIVDAFSHYAGRRLQLDETVYQSESVTGDRNRAIAHLMRSFGNLEEDVDAIIDAYFRQCSLLVTCRDLATMAATLANRGRQPDHRRARALDAALRRERAQRDEHVRHVRLRRRVGLHRRAPGEERCVRRGGRGAARPARRSASSRRRSTPAGTARAGIKVCQRMAIDFDLHPLRFQPEVRAVVRRCYHCGQTRSNRVRTPEEYDLLAQHADSVAVFELQGDLFFGSTERLFRTVVDDIAGVDAVVLDCKRIGNLDGAAIVDAVEPARRARTTSAACW